MYLIIRRVLAVVLCPQAGGDGRFKGFTLINWMTTLTNFVGDRLISTFIFEVQ